MSDYDRLAESISNLDEDTMMDVTRKLTEKGIIPQKAREACQTGRKKALSLFKESIYYEGDMLYLDKLISRAEKMLSIK